MEIIDAYIPMDRRQSLARGEQLPDRTNGAVLFADISGFTHFNTALVQELDPKRAAEVLIGHLNDVYGALISVVHRYGGSVINFGGDAITCWFDKDNGRRATAAALELQSVMEKLEVLSTPNGTQYPLKIKVAVTSGDARRFLVGQPRIQRLEVLAGAILDRMESAEDQMKSGEVIVGAEVMGRLGNQAVVKEWRKDEFDEHYAVIGGLTEPIPEKPWQEVIELEPEEASAWVLPSIYQRLLRGEGEFLAELRPAVAMFIQYKGIDYDKEDDAGLKLDTYVGWVQRILAKYEGLLLGLIIGDKGSNIFCAFGAHISHENDVDRALAAAIELITPADELAYIKDVRIGITRGQMRVGAYGAPFRRTYGVQGNDVNLAARLMSLAEPGQILTSERIIEDASRRYNFRALGRKQIKGLDDAFPVWALTNVQADTTTDILGSTIYPIIGRKTELQHLDEAQQDLQDEKSNTLIFTGEAGIGKTRLLEYAISQARLSDVKPFILLGDEVGKSSLYYAWHPVIMKLFGFDNIPGKDVPLEREEKNAHILKSINETIPDLIHLAPLLNEVLTVDIPENEWTEQMTGEVRAANIRVLLFELLSNAAKSAPLMLVVEDAQWLDSASWAMLGVVSQEIDPILMVIASRPIPEPHPEEFIELRESPITTQIQLNQFSTDEVQALICQRWEVKQLPETILDLVYEKAEGNPFFSEELAYVLRESESITLENDQVQVATSDGDLNALDFPDTSQDVIRSRIDRLTPEEQLALKVASIVGRTFSYQILSAIHPVEADKEFLIDYLDNLEQHAFTRLISPEPELTYTFKHNIVHDVAYNLMLTSQRQALHRSAAELYEDVYADDLSQVYSLLAHHWSRTNDAIKAIEFLEKAGRQAVRNFANREAISFLSGVLSRSQESGVELDDERCGLIELLLGEAYVNSGKYVEGRTHLERGLLLLGQPVPSGTLLQVLGVLGQVSLQVLHRIAPRYYIGRRADKRDALLAACRAFERLVEVYFMLNETILSLYTSFRTLNLAEDAGLSPELARGYATVGALIGFIPVHSIATSYLQRALDTANQVEDLNAHAWVALLVGFYKAGVGQWEEAEQLQEEVVKITEQLGDQRRREDAIGNLFALNYFQGKFVTSAKYAEEMIQVSRHRKVDLSLAYGLQGQAFVLHHQGHFEEAQVRLDELHSLMTDESKITDEALLMEMYGLLSINHLRRSEAQHAINMAEMAAALTDKAMPSNYSSFTAYAGPASVYLTLWEDGYVLPDIDKHARRVTGYQKKFARVFPIGQPRALLYEGWNYWLSGKRTKALNTWHKSLAFAEELEMRYDQGLVNYEIGRHLPSDDPDRRKHLLAAEKVFQEIRAAFDLERTRKGLSESQLAE